MQSFYNKKEESEKEGFNIGFLREVSDNVFSADEV
jgi:hypothetical protein